MPGQQQATQSTAISWNEIGAAAGKQYLGDGLAVAATGEGARLHCVFQKIEGHATGDDLWLTSTAAGASAGRFRVMAKDVGRAGGAVASLPGSGTVLAQDSIPRASTESAKPFVCYLQVERERVVSLGLRTECRCEYTCLGRKSLRRRRR